VSPAVAPPPRLWTRAFILLVVAHFLQALAYSSMLLLPLYLQHLGASRAEIGAIMATAAGSGLLARPFIGWSLDRLGRKPTLVVGTGITVLGMALIGLVRDVGAVAYVERAIFGVGQAALFTGYFTLAADVVPPERRTEGIALFGVSGLVPLLVNPFADQVGIQAADLRWFLPVVGGLVALSLVAALGVDEPAGLRQERMVAREVLGALRHRQLWSVWLATSLFAGMVSMFMAFASVTAERRGVEQPASLWLAYAAGAVVVRILGARLPDRIGPANLVAPAMGVYIVAEWVAMDAQSFGGFLLAALLAGVGHGYCFPVLVSQVVSRTSAAVRGSALAAFTALWAVSELWVSPALGALADAHDDAAMYGVTGASALLGLLAWLVLEHRFGPRSEPATTPAPAAGRGSDLDGSQ
jgi:MFS family permease